VNRKTNTIIFILAATVFNIIITMICFLLLIILYSQILFSLLPDNSVAWALPVIFILAIVAAIFIYRALIKVFIKKVDMEKYFDPIFKRNPRANSPPRQP